MTKTDTGGNAYASEYADMPNGMTLLDYFAGQCLPSLVAKWTTSETRSLNKMASRAYEIAAAMIAEKRRREQC